MNRKISVDEYKEAIELCDRFGFDQIDINPFGLLVISTNLRVSMGIHSFCVYVGYVMREGNFMIADNDSEDTFFCGYLYLEKSDLTLRVLAENSVKNFYKNWFNDAGLIGG